MQLHKKKNWLSTHTQAPRIQNGGRFHRSNIREFKKLRQQLQRKPHIKIELCVKLSLLRLFHVDHVVQNTQIALSLAWY